jgi:hypothetical protein
VNLDKYLILNSYRWEFCDSVRLDGDTISDWVHFQQVYQGVMRSALRVPDDPEPVCVSVPDQYTALQQAQLFPGCKLVSLGMDDWKLPKRGRPSKYATDEEQKVARKQQDKEKAKRYRDKLDDKRRDSITGCVCFRHQ